MGTGNPKNLPSGATWPPALERILKWSRIVLFLAAAYGAYLLWPLFRAPVQ